MRAGPGRGGGLIGHERPDPPYPSIGSDAVGWLTTDDMIEVDRVMIEDLHIELIQMMENAGRNLAHLTLASADPAAAVVVAGRGGNGGGGLVAARHLANSGVDVTVVLTRARHRFEGVPGHQLDIIERLDLNVIEPPFEHALPALLADADAVVDAAIGYSLGGAPSGPAAKAIVAVNAADRFVVALDTPSGLDTATGAAPGVVVDADVTLTLAAPKLGLRRAAVVGELFVGDISVPPTVLERLGHRAPDFSRSPIIAVSDQPPAPARPGGIGSVRSRTTRD